MGKLNMDLANFSLTSKAGGDKKASVSMNAMKSTGSGSGSTPVSGSNPMSPQTLSPQHRPGLAQPTHQAQAMGTGLSGLDLL